jgi:hypothetical protein
MTELVTLFAELAVPLGASSADGLYSGSSVPGTQHHLAKNSRGRPVVLLSAEEFDTRPASLQLQNLQVEHGIRCRIAKGSGIPVDSHFTVAQCRTDDALLQRCFLDLFDAILAELPDSPSQREVAQAIDRMAALFLAVERPPRRAAQGLWGELLLIVRATDPQLMAESWHNEASERYDFASMTQRLEVKTSADRTRRHHFSLEQVHPSQGLQCVIASMFLESSPAGVSLGDLWDQVRDALSGQPDLRVHIDEICLSALGSSWQQARALAFDEQLAIRSLAFYDARDIPRLPLELPDGVTEVRFRSDLSQGAPIHESSRDATPLIELFHGPDGQQPSTTHRAT